jgi:MscS family membrane protein
MEEFFELTNAGKWHAAAQYLSVPQGSDSARASQLAERLKVVLDRYLWVDLAEVSPLAAGDTADGLTAATEQLGVIPRPNGLYEPVRLIRASREGQPAWVVSPSTVRRIDEWYGDLGDNWIRELFPEALRRTGPLRVQWWQWLALLAAVPLVILAGTVLERLVMLVLQAVVRRTVPTWDNDLVRTLRAPLLLLCVSLFIGPVINRIGLNASVQGFVAAMIKALVTAALFWAIIRALDVAERRVVASAWAAQRSDVLSLAPLGARLARIFVGFLGVTAILSQFNIPVGTLLAGLGIGGLAVALGAQKTLENVIGSLAIVADKPFEVGDWVKVEDIEGTVESVRLRSTQIRTFDRTLVTYPNGRLADMRLESYAARDRFRVHAKFGLTYGSTKEQVDGICRDVEAWLRAHPKIWPDMVFCRLVAFGDSALQMEAMSWFLVPDVNAFRPIRQEALLAIMEIVERNGSSLAFPTTRVIMDATTPGRRDA